MLATWAVAAPVGGKFELGRSNRKPHYELLGYEKKKASRRDAKTQRKEDAEKSHFKETLLKDSAVSASLREVLRFGKNT